MGKFEITELICPESIPNVVATYNVVCKIKNVFAPYIRMKLFLKTTRPDGTEEELSVTDRFGKDETKEFTFEVESTGEIGIYKHEARVAWHPPLLLVGVESKSCETASGTVLVISADRWEGALAPKFTRSY